MTSRLFLSNGPGEIRAALAENDVIVELRIARETQPSFLGGIFLARVTRVVPAIPAAFLDLGGSVTAFLPCGPNAPMPVEGAALMVQIVKEAHGGKPPEVTMALSIQATHLTWTPARPSIAVSRKIPPAERVRLSALLKRILRDGEGAVIRTHGSGASEEVLLADAEFGRSRYAKLLTMAKTARPPARLDLPEAPATLLVSGFAREAVDEIVVDDLNLAPELRNAGHGQVTAQDQQCFTDIGFDDAFAAALSRMVDVGGLATLAIDITEACTLIDVNLGAAARGQSRQAILDANIAAAAEIGRQIRLRNLSGAIVIDFISMPARAQRELVEQSLKEVAMRDPVAVEFHGWTRVGHFELTRQRRYPSLAEIFLEPPAQPRKTPQTVAYEVLRAITRASLPPGPGEVRLHPKVAGILQGAFALSLETAIRSSGHRIFIEPDAGRDPETFEIAPASSSLYL